MDQLNTAETIAVNKHHMSTIDILERLQLSTLLQKSIEFVLVGLLLSIYLFSDCSSNSGHNVNGKINKIYSNSVFQLWYNLKWRENTKRTAQLERHVGGHMKWPFSMPRIVYVWKLFRICNFNWTYFYFVMLNQKTNRYKTLFRPESPIRRQLITY